MALRPSVYLSKNSGVSCKFLVVQILNDFYIISPKKRNGLACLDALRRRYVVLLSVRTQIRILHLRSNNTFPVRVAHYTHGMSLAYAIQRLFSNLLCKLPMTFASQASLHSLKAMGCLFEQ
jgi:hypothetical protein